MSVTPAVQSLVDTLYKTSDIGPEAHQAYVDLFLPNTTLIMGPVVYQGQEGVLKFRETGWEKVSSRKHDCKAVFQHPSNPNEVMTYGTVDYGFKDGTSKVGIEWAGRLVAAEDANGQLKIQFYQVHLTLK